MKVARRVGAFVAVSMLLTTLGCPDLPKGPEAEVGSGSFCFTCTTHFRPDGQRYTLTTCFQTQAERDSKMATHAQLPDHFPKPIEY